MINYDISLSFSTRGITRIETLQRSVIRPRMQHYLNELCRGIVQAIHNRTISVTPRDYTTSALVDALTFDNVVSQLVRVLERQQLGEHAKGTVFRWLISQKLAPDEQHLDPIIPTSQQGNVGMQCYLRSRGLTASVIDSVEREFKNIIITAHQDKLLSSQQLRPSEVTIIPIGTVPGSSGVGAASSYRVSVRQLKFFLTNYRYNKLKTSYIGRPDEFVYRVGLLMMRYEPLTNLCSGYSGGCSMHLFDVFRSELGTTWELFSSPLNCTLAQYLSPHQDTDQVFGSKGNFFDRFHEITALGGSFQLNPPFTEEYLSIATSMVLDSLEKYTEVPLTFVYIHPTWTDLYGYKEMQKGKYLIAELCFSAKNHFYESGMQHNPQYRKLVNSSAPSTIFILQNDIARTVRPITSSSLERIRIAFTSRGK